MDTEYYDSSGAPANGSAGSSAVMRSEFDLIQAAFAKLPDLSGNANKVVVVNSGATGLTVLAGALALAIAFTTAGSGSITLTAAGATNVTLPTTGTLATLAGSEELTNKTLNASVAKGTWTASGTWTVPALTLGGTVTSNGQSFSGTIANLGTVTTADINGGTVDGAVIGGASAAAGTFTSLNATGGGALTGTWSNLGVVTTIDINGGTVDGAIVGGTSAAAGSFTTLASSGVATLNSAVVSTTLGVTGVATFTAAPVFSSGTASQTVELTSGKALTTVAITGTGNYVKSAGPTMTGTIGAASMTLSGTLDVTGVTALTGGATVPTAKNITGTGTATVTGFATVSATTLTGTISTAAQPNITSLGTLASVSISGGTITGITDLAVADGGTGASTAANARTNLGVVIGTDVQAQDAELAAIAGLTSAADRLPYFTGSGTASLATFTTFGRSLVDDADAATGRATLSAAGSGAVTASGITMTSARLLGRVTASTGAIEEITVGSGLLLSAGTLSSTAGGGSVTSIDVSGGTTGLTTSGGAVTGAGTITLAGTLAVANGGTGSTTAANARTALGLAIGTDVQAYDATLLSIAALGTASDKIAYTTGVDTWAETALTSFGRSLIDDAASSNARTTLGLVIGTDVQAYDAELAAIAGLTSAANKVPYFTGSGTAAVGDLTSFGRSLIDDADASAGRTTLGLGALAILATVGTSQIDADSVTYAKIQNVTATDKLLGRSTVGAGDIEEITCTSFGRSLIDDADASTARTTLGLGALATLPAVDTAQIQDDAVTYAKLQNITTARVLGRTTASTGNVEELSAGTGVVFTVGTIALNGELTAIAGLTSAADKLPYFTGSATAALSAFTSFGRSLVDDADASTARTTLGLAIGTDVQAYDASTAKLNVEDQALTGGVIVTSKSLGTVSSGTCTPDPGDRPLQHYTNNGAHTLAPSGNAGSILVDITNGASAGAITTSGFTRVAGDSFTTTNAQKFRCHISVGNAGSLLVVQALQ